MTPNAARNSGARPVPSPAPTMTRHSSASSSPHSVSSAWRSGGRRRPTSGRWSRPGRSRRARCARTGGCGPGTAAGRRSRFRRTRVPESCRGSGWPGRVSPCRHRAGRSARPGRATWRPAPPGPAVGGSRATSPGNRRSTAARSTARCRRATSDSDSPLPPAVEAGDLGGPTGTTVPRTPMILSPSCSGTNVRSHHGGPNFARRDRPADRQRAAGLTLRRRSVCRRARRWAARSFWTLRGGSTRGRRRRPGAGDGLERLVDVPEPAAGVEEEDPGSVDWWNRAAQEPRGVGSGEGSGMNRLYHGRPRHAFASHCRMCRRLSRAIVSGSGV